MKNQKSRKAFGHESSNEQEFFVEVLPRAKGRSRKSAPPVKIPTSKKSKSKPTNGGAWEMAYDMYDEHRSKGVPVTYIEPDVTSKIYTKNKDEVNSFAPDKSGYLVNWPRPKKSEKEFIWHLGDDFTELGKARERVWKSIGKKKIRVAHIDTGYQLGHPSRPEKLLWKLGKSFKKGESENPGIDHSLGSFQEQDGHGNATLAFLAGGKISNEHTFDMYEGYFGGIPFAEVVPIRIHDTVALIRSKVFVKAIEYAIDTGCEVVTMSMAGMPSRAWAKVVNKAYEAGVTLVTAGGNSWIKGANKLLPRSLLYPARFDRVIAACGVTANQQPYVFKANKWPRPKSEGGEWMQGNFGPQKRMASAISAYTPNVPWGTTNQNEPFVLNGGGTSSATPQVAAAAALWLIHHQDWLEERGYRGTWRQVEAVRYALFQSAKKVKKYEKFLGNGVIQADKALGIRPAKNKLKMSSKANVVFTGLTELIGLLIKTKAGPREKKVESPKNMDMYMLELTQLFHQEPDLQYLCEIDLDDREEVMKVFSKSKLSKLKKVVKESTIASAHLKAFIAQIP